MRKHRVEALERRTLLAFGLDLSWAASGRVETPSGTLMEILPDGDILAMGTHILPSRHFDDINDESLARRINPDGTIDTSFGNGGVIDFEGYIIRHAALVGSRFYVGFSAESFIRAYTLSGVVDTTFSGDGGVNLSDFSRPHGGRSDDTPDLTRLQVLPDGGLLLSMELILHGPSPSDIATFVNQIVKMRADGTLDTSFGDEGFLVDAVSPPGSSDPSAIVGGNAIYVAQSTNELWHYTLGGTLDTSFGTGGKVTLATNPRRIFIQPDGKILYAAQPATGEDQHLYRLNADGSADTSFGDNGRVLLEDPLTNEPFSVGVIEVDDDDFIWLSGDNGLYRFSPSVLSPPPLDGSRHDLAGAESFTQQIEFDEEGGVFLGGGDLIYRLDDPGDVFVKNGVLYVGGATGDDTITVTTSGSDIVVTCNGASQSFAASSVNVLSLDGFHGNDTITNDTSLKATLRGGWGNDTLYGGTGEDRIHGGAGEDSLWGREGPDRLYGEDGVDSLYGNGGNDRAEGGAQPDHVRGNGGRDKLYGNGGNDKLYGGASGDFIYGQAGRDQILGEGGNDRLYSDDGDRDTLRGGAGDDFFITLDSVADVLFGDGGRDSVNGDAADVLTSIEA